MGALNTALNFLLINIAIVLTGITAGVWFLLISFISFCVVVLHSFLWNRYRIFARDNPHELHKEYVAFFVVTGTTALLSLGLLHVLVNILGAPFGISPHIWANIALACTVPLTMVCNFLGYKFFVFTERVV